MGATAFISVHAICLPITLAITLAMGKMHKNNDETSTQRLVKLFQWECHGRQAAAETGAMQQ